MTKLVTVHEVLYHVPDDHPAAHGGPFGDGSFIQRFPKKNKADAEAFAKANKYNGKPATVNTIEVSAKTAARWGV